MSVVPSPSTTAADPAMPHEPAWEIARLFPDFVVTVSDLLPTC